MNIRILVLAAVIFSFFGCSRIIVLDGLYEEKYLGTGDMMYSFDSNYNFNQYADDGMVSYFSRGSYSIVRNRLTLEADSIYVDSALVVDSVLGIGDSIEIMLLLHDFTPLDTNMFIYSSNDTNLDYQVSKFCNLCASSFYDTPVRIGVKIKKGDNDLVIIRVNDLQKKKKYDININIESFTYLKVEYFPSFIYYEFNGFDKELIKLKKVPDNIIEFRFNDNRYTQGYQLVPSTTPK